MFTEKDHMFRCLVPWNVISYVTGEFKGAVELEGTLLGGP